MRRRSIPSHTAPRWRPRRLHSGHVVSEPHFRSSLSRRAGRSPLTLLSRYRTQLGISLRVVRAILRNPSLRRVQLAFLLFNAVEFGTWVAILLYAYEAIGPTSVGLVAVVQLVPGAVLAPFIAGLGDRIPRDRLLFLGYLAQMAAYGATWVGMALGAAPLVVVLAATCAATALSVTRPAQGSLIPSLSRTPEELTAANGLSGTMEGAGMLVGPLVAAAILAVATPTTVFGAATIASLLAAMLVVRLPSAGTAGGGRGRAETARRGGSEQPPRGAATGRPPRKHPDHRCHPGVADGGHRRPRRPVHPPRAGGLRHRRVRCRDPERRARTGCRRRRWPDVHVRRPAAAGAGHRDRGAGVRGRPGRRRHRRVCFERGRPRHRRRVRLRGLRRRRTDDPPARDAGCGPGARARRSRGSGFCRPGRRLTPRAARGAVDRRPADSDRVRPRAPGRDRPGLGRSAGDRSARPGAVPGDGPAARGRDLRAAAPAVARVACPPDALDLHRARPRAHRRGRPRRRVLRPRVGPAPGQPRGPADPDLRHASGRRRRDRPAA